MLAEENLWERCKKNKFILNTYYVRWGSWI